MTGKIQRIDLSKKFDKQLKSSPLKIKEAFRERFILFLKNSFDTKLNNHALTGKYSGYRSINITGDWRAIYSISKNEDNGVIIVFETLGTHSQLYK